MHYGRLDWWRQTEQATEAEVRAQAERIEQRGRNADEVATREAYLDLLEIRPWGEHVLEVGCGSGVVLREIARRVPGLLAAAGVQNVRVRAFTTLERDPTSYYGGLCRRRAENALEAGVITSDEARRWLEQLEAEQSPGRFLAGLTQLFAWGVRA